MSSSMACLGTSGTSSPCGSSVSLPVVQNKLPGFGAVPLTAEGLYGSVEVSPVSCIVSRVRPNTMVDGHEPKAFWERELNCGCVKEELGSPSNTE